MSAVWFDELIKEENYSFINGTRVGSRKKTALRLSKIFKFQGGYMAAYRAVKHGYTACCVTAGRLEDGRYGINAHGEHSNFLL